MREQIWGSDTFISLPQPLEDTNVEMIDMQGFCFTPQGLRVNASNVDRDELLMSGYGPRSGESSA